jgi:hypothetical protein
MIARITLIFRKDLHRLWPYVLGLWAITACGVAIDAAYYDQFGMGGHYLFNLIPLLEWTACWVLVVLLIQQERLVGHDPYWLARPIAWQDLLSAKALFIVAAVVPVWICHRALWFSGDLSSVAQFTLLLVLPAAAFACVTSNLGQSVLGFAATVLALSVLAPMAMFWPGHTSAADAIVAAAVSLAVILLQYSRRRENLARAILLAGIAALVVSMLLVH